MKSRKKNKILTISLDGNCFLCVLLVTSLHLKGLFQGCSFEKVTARKRNVCVEKKIHA